MVHGLFEGKQIIYLIYLTNLFNPYLVAVLSNIIFGTATKKCSCFGTSNCGKQKTLNLLYRGKNTVSYCDVCKDNTVRLKRISNSGFTYCHFSFIVWVVIGVGLAILYETFGLLLFCSLAYREKCCKFANLITVILLWKTGYYGKIYLCKNCLRSKIYADGASFQKIIEECGQFVKYEVKIPTTYVKLVDDISTWIDIILTFLFGSVVIFYSYSVYLDEPPVHLNAVCLEYLRRSPQEILQLRIAEKLTSIFLVHVITIFGQLVLQWILSPKLYGMTLVEFWALCIFNPFESNPISKQDYTYCDGLLASTQFIYVVYLAYLLNPYVITILSKILSKELIILSDIIFGIIEILKLVTLEVRIGIIEILKLVTLAVRILFINLKKKWISKIPCRISKLSDCAYEIKASSGPQNHYVMKSHSFVRHIVHFLLEDFQRNKQLNMSGKNKSKAIRRITKASEHVTWGIPTDVKKRYEQFGHFGRTLDTGYDVEIELTDLYSDIAFKITIKNSIEYWKFKHITMLIGCLKIILQFTLLLPLLLPILRFIKKSLVEIFLTRNKVIKQPASNDFELAREDLLKISSNPSVYVAEDSGSDTNIDDSNETFNQGQSHTDLETEDSNTKIGLQDISPEIQEYFDSIEHENQRLKETLPAVEVLMKKFEKTLDENEKLKTENKNLKAEVQRLIDDRTCIICMDNEILYLFLPCKHLVSCENCAQNPALKECPLCRKVIQKRLKTYMS